jgi:hypothetical protein
MAHGGSSDPLVARWVQGAAPATEGVPGIAHEEKLAGVRTGDSELAGKTKERGGMGLPE